MEDKNRFISLLSDYGFKATFADEANTLFLRTALQALLQSDDAIVSVYFARNEFSGVTKGARGGIFDLICTDEKNRTFIVEMQLGHYKHFIQRSKFYAFHRFNTLVAKGDFKFENLPPIYCIGFLAKGIFPRSNHYYHFARLTNQRGQILDDQITHIIVEINKFKKEAHQIQSDLDKLIYIMKHSKEVQENTQSATFLHEKWIMQALEKLDKTKMTPDQRMHYEMTRARVGSTLHMREEEIREAREESREKGREEALRTTAKKMKDIGIDHAIIVQTTGLSMEVVQEL